jgi:hypothetical protein
MKIAKILLRFDKHLHTTQKAFLIRIGLSDVWLPKKLCSKFITNKKLGGNVVIPAFLYERITGKPAPIEDAQTIIEKHVPVKIELKELPPDAELTR